MIAQRLPKPKKCRECRKEFQPTRAIQPVCEDMECKVAYATKAAERARAKREAKARKDLREAKEKAKKRGEWMAEAQAAFNSYIRARDRAAGHGCIDCGKPFGADRFGGSMDAGHYLGRGTAPHLRFDERNVHAQRKGCNRPGGTTREKFRAGMIERIGLKALEDLEADNTPKHYSIDDLKEIKRKYSRMARALVNAPSHKEG